MKLIRIIKMELNWKCALRELYRGWSPAFLLENADEGYYGNFCVKDSANKQQNNGKAGDSRHRQPRQSVAYLALAQWFRPAGYQMLKNMACHEYDSCQSYSKKYVS